jgi:heptaprenyl diphosphate synthase
MQLYTQRDDHRIAWFTALAITIHIAESALPSPLLGVKPGLANVITIAVLMRFGWRMAVWVSLLRVVAGSLLMGTFLSPTFMLSFSGAVASTLVLILLSQLPAGWRCSAVGYSVTSALCHMWVQFWVAYSLFIHHAGLFHLLPLLLTAALLFGMVSGVIANHLLQNLQRMEDKDLSNSVQV